MGAKGRVVAVCSAGEKGEKKKPVDVGILRVEHGLVGDAHAGSERQVSLLATESIGEIRRLGLDVSAGDFAENLTTEGLSVHTLPVGTRLRVGQEAVLEITQIGKECHERCAIFEQVGTCVMPTQGVFARVVAGGEVRPGDTIEVVCRAGAPAPASGGPGQARPTGSHELRVAILVASDRAVRGERKDATGPALRRWLEAKNAQVTEVRVVPDDQERIAGALMELCKQADVVLTAGGTGLAERDVTPEATAAVIERAVPGIAEAMRAAGLRSTPHAMLSRGIAGVRGHSLIINLPGSPKGAVESLEAVWDALPHAVAVIRGPVADEEHAPPKCKGCHDNKV
jgi:molybdenum cofactor synthesis domain-containing protein